MTRTWLITGASSGLGRALAAAVADAGDNVVAVARRAERLYRLAERYPGRIAPLAFDLCDPDAAGQLVSRTLDTFGSLDVLVNNAGIVVPGAAEELDDASFRAQFDVNLFSIHRLTRCALPAMRQRAGGMIVMVSSEAGAVAQGGFAAYAASKFALEGLSEALRVEVAPFGVRVVIVEPGPLRTAFGRDSPAEGRAVLDCYPSTAEWAATYAGVLGDPDAAATAIRRAVDESEPPRRLVLGRDALSRIRETLTQRIVEIDAWHAVSISVTAGT
jgi:NAD(P)-dependent dehydrogenase (short-subunit alcohol dehydrogenase family)